ncbi:MAG: preprotein translocase subunit SecY [archaeon]
MSFFDNILNNLPEVAPPKQKRLSFKEKLKWTGSILLIFFVLGLVPLFGLGQNQLDQFEILSIILGASFGSIISLGIGPLVTASIVLQLLNGSGIMKLDLTSHEGKRRFQGLQKMLAIFFIIFEAFIYVFMGGLAPPPALAGTAAFFHIELMLVFQLFVGGVLIMFMDEVVSKWGFGSGISLFIAAGVSQSIFIRALSPLEAPNLPGSGIPTGAIPALFIYLGEGDPINAGLMFAAVASTILVFMLSVYSQAMKIEIPLSFGRIRGYGMRWPLNFLYTSNIPVILIAALMANLQLWGRLLQNWGLPLLGTYVGNSPDTGLVTFLSPPNLVKSIITSSLTTDVLIRGLGYLVIMVIGAVVFSWFWMQTAGMDAKSQAKQIMSSGLQIPGFRKDQRVLERLLDRYIKPLTVLGGIAIGILAAIADLSGALGNGTGILLTVMIVYKLYEEIARDHMMDMHPALRKMME